MKTLNKLFGIIATTTLIIATVQSLTLSAQGWPTQPEISSVTLRTGDKDNPLQAVYGDFIGVALLSSSSFDGQKADVRTTETSVKLTFKIAKYVKGSVFLVKLDTKNDRRVLKLSMSAKIDKKYIIDTDIKETESGVYEVTPKKALEPGEYGLFTPVKNGLPDTGGTLYDFGIDK